LPTFRRRELTEVWRGSVIALATAEIEGPDGEVFRRDVVTHPGAVSAVPLGPDGRVTLVRQYRAPIDVELLEIPAGKRDVADEPPELTAARELEEEIGMRPGRLDLLARFHNSPGFCDERSWVFLARDLEAVASSAHSIEETHMTIERVALDDVPGLIAAGEITDAKTIIGLSLTLLGLRTGTLPL
jgi:ADP-ribose pyrophosphatase